MPDESVLAAVIRSRRTIGVFAPEPIDAGLVREALELACWAPNHHKTEPWRFLELGPETRQQIVDLNTRLIAEKKGPDAAAAKQKQWSSIPGWIVVTCPRSDDPLLAEEDYAACCCAIQNLTLALWSHGVGSKWSTGDVTRHPGFFQLLNLDPVTTRVVGLIWYGRPAAIPQQTRLPIDDVYRRLP